MTHERRKPTLVVVGKKTVIDRRRWNDNAMADYIMACGQDKWLKIADLSRVAYDRNDEPNRKRVARYLHKIRKLLRQRGKLLLYESDPNTRRILAVKLCDPSLSLDRQYARQYLEWMRTRSQMTAEEYEEAIFLLHTPGETAEAAVNTA
jgi:hypothetical protein